MNVYFMRHGHTNYNLLGLCNDDPARDVHLTELGLSQAQAAAERLREARIERIFVSPLPRTRQTAEIVNRHHGAPIEIHPGLHDIRSGFDGRPVAEYFAAVAHDPLRARVNGGESLLDHKARVLCFLDWLRERPEDTLLVVAHEETLRVFMAQQQGIPDERLRQLHIGNCEYLCYPLRAVSRRESVMAITDAKA